MQGEKYDVYKAGSWERIEDAVVIRKQDVFAAPALQSYANSIIVALEIMRGTDADKEVLDRLQMIADYFHTAALSAEQSDFKKIPD